LVSIALHPGPLARNKRHRCLVAVPDQTEPNLIKVHDTFDAGLEMALHFCFPGGLLMFFRRLSSLGGIVLTGARGYSWVNV
jgi:hypothetical protein